MGLPSRQHDHAWYRDAADRRDDPRSAQTVPRQFRRRVASGLIATIATLTTGAATAAETLRVATYNTELQRDGPGLFLRDLVRGADDQINAVLAVVATADADVLALQGIDYDLTGAALTRLAEAMGYPYFFSLRPNTGMPTGLDMDGDGRLGGPRDAQGYGRFSGQGGMAVLSRYPIDVSAVQDFSGLLWLDVPGALLPTHKDKPFPSAEAQAAQRLSTTGHWILPISGPGGTFNLMTFHASPPVFDGPEDRNGRRNYDEIRLWSLVLDGEISETPSGPFVIAGDANLDPIDGDGIKTAIRALIDRPDTQDIAPRGHSGTDTVNWTDPVPGDLRTSYVLPSTHWRVIDSGVMWPAPDDSMAETTATASRHHLVWVDLSY